MNDHSNLSQTDEDIYEIYPIPHSIEYFNGNTILNGEIQVIYDDTIDEVTKRKVKKTFITNGFSEPEISVNLSDEKINVLIGTKNSGGPVDNYVKENIKNKVDFSQIDAYQLEIQDNNIVILGKNSDASFYGVVTLKTILKQISEEKKIQHLSIRDYANTEVRGFIEGFYGIPWSNEERIELIKFGSKFKTTNYIFAPKDDPYHRERWYELYPKDMLAEINKMAEIGNENKTRFVWTISPLIEVASIAQESGEVAAMELLEENTEKLLRKFDQLYDVGVRQFGVLGDDVGALPLDYVVELMQSVSKWADEKGDVYDTIYTPAAYNAAWAWDGGRELNIIEEGFADNIHIHWTGSNTVAPIDQSTIDFFKYTDSKDVVRRNPLFWLNWPVNDIDYSLVLLGKGEMLKPGVKNLTGVVTNPMQEAEASKVSIFAVADYSWNTEDFDDQKSWEDSLKYIESAATRELSVLARHMTSADTKVGFVAEESEDIKKFIDVIKQLLEVSQSLSEKSEVDQLINELKTIAKNANDYLNNAKNEKLKIELEPFIKALRDLVLAAKDYIDVLLLLEKNKKEAALDKFSDAQSLYTNSLNYDRPILTGDMKAKPAQRRLQPFVKELNDIISKKIEDN